MAAVGDCDGTNQPLALLPLIDNNTAPRADNVKIRVVHAAPFSNVLANTAVSVRTEAGAIVNGLTSVQFARESGFFEVPAATYDLKISTPDGGTTLIDPAAVALPAGTVVTLFGVGDGTNQPLGITAVFGDGTSAALPLQTTGGGVQRTGQLAKFELVRIDGARGGLRSGRFTPWQGSTRLLTRPLNSTTLHIKD